MEYKQKFEIYYSIACKHMIECTAKRPKGLLGIRVDDDIWARRYRAWDKAAMDVLHRIVRGMGYGRD